MEVYKHNLVSQLFYYYLDDIIKNSDNTPTIFSIYTYAYFQLLFNISCIFNNRLKISNDRINLPRSFYTLKNMCSNQNLSQRNILHKIFVFYAHQGFMTTLYKDYSQTKLRLSDVYIEELNININIINLIYDVAKSHLELKQILVENIKNNTSKLDWGIPSDITGKPDFKPKNADIFEPLVIPNGTFVNENGIPIIDINYTSTFNIQDYSEKITLLDNKGIVIDYTSPIFNTINSMVKKSWDNGISSEIDNVIYVSQNLSTYQKTVADFLTFHNNTSVPMTAFWIIIAILLSQRYNQSFDNDIIMLYCLSVGLFDGCLSYHTLKSKYYIARPIQFIRCYLKNKEIKHWIPSINIGAKWLPYQPLNIVSPSSPDVVSEYSVISNISSSIIEWWFKTNNLYDPCVLVSLPNPHIISKSLNRSNKIISIGEFIFNYGPISIEKSSNITDETILIYRTLDDLKKDCSNACLYAGISTQNSIDCGILLGTDIGNTCKAHFENVYMIKSPY